MLGFLVPVGNGTADPLNSVAAAEAFWRALPRDDMIAAQSALSAALADAIGRRGTNVDRLRALLALDQRARTLVDALLANCVARNPQSSLLRTQFSQSAFELCRSFGRAHGQLLRSMRDSAGAAASREYLPYVALRFFQHRHAELLLRPFADESFTWFSWKEVHEVYRFVQSRDLLHAELSVNRWSSPSASETTLEREYVHVLLQDVINGGQFPSQDAFWISQSIPRWSREAVLESQQVKSAGNRFAVDLDGDEGLARSNLELADSCLSLDMAPVLASMRQETAVLRDDPGAPIEGSSMGGQRQLKLLRKLSVLFEPERPVIARRGERQPIALTVEVSVGISQILSELRCEESGAGGSARARLMMVDRSDSGCRLHGPTLGMTPIAPGELIAFREEAASSWTLAVVRRVKKRMAGKRVEIGVEYLGRDPRRIVVVFDTDASPARAPASVPARFAALFVPESAEAPVLPIRTLILPACGLVPEDRLSVRSRTDRSTVQLKEPLEEQADFVWSPFEIVER